MIRENCKEGIPIILLANKTDLKDQRQVTEEEAINLSINEEYVYRETSCVKNENVADAFETIVEMWNIDKEKNTPSRSLSDENLQKKLEDKNLAQETIPLSARNNKNTIDNGEDDKINLSMKKEKKITKVKRSFC